MESKFIVVRPIEIIETSVENIVRICAWTVFEIAAFKVGGDDSYVLDNQEFFEVKEIVFTGLKKMVEHGKS